jgi:thymidylate kinase
MNADWNVSGLIIEGVCGTGKTAVLRELLRSDAFLNRSFVSSIVFSEHQTQRVLEQKERTEGLDPVDNIGLLEGIVGMLESMNNRLNRADFLARNRVDQKLVYVLERFHLTHVCDYDHIEWEMVKEIDARLSKLNARLCVLKAQDEAIGDRIMRNRGPCWLDYVKRFGNTREEIVEHYVEAQQEILKMSELTSLPVIVIDTTSSKPEDVTGQIIEFWGILG